MSLLKKMAQVAARKAFLANIIGKAPAEIKECIEQICADATSVDALQHYAMVTSKEEGMYPLTTEMIEGFDMPAEIKDLLCSNPAIVAYLNELLSQFQKS